MDEYGTDAALKISYIIMLALAFDIGLVVGWVVWH